MGGSNVEFGLVRDTPQKIFDSIIFFENFCFKLRRYLRKNLGYLKNIWDIPFTLVLAPLLLEIFCKE